MNDDDDDNETNNQIDHSFTRPQNHGLDSALNNRRRQIK